MTARNTSWDVPEGWYGCECGCPDAQAHRELQANNLAELDAHTPPPSSIEIVEDTDAWCVQIKYPDGWLLVSRATPHRALIEAAYKQQKDHTFPRWQQVAYTGWMPIKTKDMTMNIKKTLRPGVCAALRCTETDLLVGNAPGTPWGVESVGLCDRHYEQCVKEYPGVFADDEGKALKAAGTTPATPATPAMPATDATEIPDAREEHEKDLLSRKQEADGVTQVAREWPIDTQRDLEELGGYLQEVKSVRDDLAEEMKQRIGPLKHRVRDEEALYRPLKKAWEAAEAAIKGRFAKARVIEEERNLAAKRAAAEAFEEGRSEDISSEMEKITHVNEVDNVTTILKWGYVIEDESALPREFLMPNLKLIKEHCNHSTDKTPTPISGVKFIPDAQVRGGRKRPSHP